MYGKQYIATFNNIQNNRMRLEIYHKDYSGATSELKWIGCVVEYPNGEEKKDDIILSAKATLKFWSGLTDALTNETFLTDYYDEWKVRILCDEIEVFQGFIEPSEGGYSFKDRPFVVEITCTDGLGLLKNIPLSDKDGVEFEGLNRLIHYLAGALTKTNLDLPIRIHCNLFNTQMEDRDVSFTNDMFRQLNVNYQRFKKDVNEFVSCYEALEMMLYGFKVFQFQGKWLVSYVGEMVGDPGPKTYYTDYDYQGGYLFGNFDDGGPVNVGKDQKIHPVKADQLVSWQFPVSSAKTTFNFELPENLVNNAKLQDVGAQILPYTTSTSYAYELIGWKAIQGEPSTSVDYTGTKRAYIRVTNDTYERELDRYIVIEGDTAAPGSLHHQVVHTNEDFWVVKGDKIDISISARQKIFESSNPTLIKVALFIGGSKSVSSNWWTLESSNNTWTNNDTKTFGSTTFLDVNTFRDFSVSDSVIPADGQLYFFLGIDSTLSSANELYVKPPQVTYTPILSGSVVQVKGDYWNTTQNKNIKDKLEEEIYLSDSIRKIFKGALWTEDGQSLTTPTWYRMGNPTERHHYTDLVNLSKYQLNYRRFKRISGSFRGVLCFSDNKEDIFYPLCFHKHYRFIDDFSNRMYLLTTPLTIDYKEAMVNATFVEVANSNADDTVAYGDARTFKYIF